MISLSLACSLSAPPSLSPIRINNRSKQSSDCSLLRDIMCLNKWMLAVSTWICHMATKARRIGAVCFVMGIRRRHCQAGCSQSTQRREREAHLPVRSGRGKVSSLREPCNLENYFHLFQGNSQSQLEMYRPNKSASLCYQALHDLPVDTAGWKQTQAQRWL